MPKKHQVTREHWNERHQAAKKLMESRRDIRKIFIEIAAQHPLVDGEHPNREFSQRLLMGVELYHKNRINGYEVELFVPGSRHSYHGVDDKLSLSQAGCEFLINHGVPLEQVHGVDLIKKYKGKAGVYHSADECFVAASYFKDGEFGQLLSVASPEHLMRKALHYIWFGVLPLMHAAPSTLTYHDFLNEAFERVPSVLTDDPDLQDPHSELANSLRERRVPKDGRIE